MSKETSETTPAETSLFKKSFLMIDLSEDKLRYEVTWSYKGRDDLMGSGTVNLLTGYNPDRQTHFVRKRLGTQSGDSGFAVIPVSPEVIVIEYQRLYDGGSKYSYDKYKGDSGLIAIDAGKVRSITEAQAITILAARKPVAETPASEKPASEKPASEKKSLTTTRLSIPYSHQESRATAKEAGAKWDGASKTWVLTGEVPDDLKEYVVVYVPPKVKLTDYVVKQLGLVRYVIDTVCERELKDSDKCKAGLLANKVLGDETMASLDLSAVTAKEMREHVTKALDPIVRQLYGDLFYAHYLEIQSKYCGRVD